MEPTIYSDALAALAHPGRMEIFRLLVRRYPNSLQPSEIADCLRMRRNTLSTHLTVMKRARLLTTLREGRGVFCQVDLAAVGDLVRYLTADCCRGRPDLCTPLQLGPANQAALTPSADRPFNVLFVCTKNAARSITAESILSREGGDVFRAYSAGTQPQTKANAMALEILRQKHHTVEALKPKNVERFRTSDAPRMDFVFTLCDRAANEDCPPWPGAALCAHWSVPDPVAAKGARSHKTKAFQRAYDLIEERIAAFIALPLRSLDRRALQLQLDAIGRLNGDAGRDGVPGQVVVEPLRNQASGRLQ